VRMPRSSHRGYYVVLAALLLYAPTSQAAETNPGVDLVVLLLGKSPLTPDQEKLVAHNFRLGSQAYLAAVERISASTFLDRTDLSAQQASIMILAAASIRDSWAPALDAAELLERRPTAMSETSLGKQETLFCWIVIARAIAVQQSNMETLRNAKVVDSEWPIPLSIALGGIFDKLILPKAQPQRSVGKERQVR